jgi:hypothetical protein
MQFANEIIDVVFMASRLPQSAFFGFEVLYAAQSEVRCSEVNLRVSFETKFVA